MKAPACLSDALALAATQSDECTIRPKEDGWHITLKSADTVSMCDILVKADAFDAYAEGEPFCFKTADMLKALRRTSPADIDVGDRIAVSGNDLKVRMPKLASEDPPRVPALQLDATAIAPLSALSALIGDSDKSAVIRFDVGAGGLTAGIEDEQGYGTVLSIPADRLTVLVGEAVAYYPLSHVAPMLKALPKDAQVCLELSSDYPCVMSCAMDGWTASMLVAPRVNTE